MQLLQQLLGAILNKQAFGTDDGGLIAQGKAAFAGNDKNAILSIAGALNAFNRGGDNLPFPPGIDPGSADAVKAKANAYKTFWDSLP